MVENKSWGTFYLSNETSWYVISMLILKELSLPVNIENIRGLKINNLKRDGTNFLANNEMSWLDFRGDLTIVVSS